MNQTFWGVASAAVGRLGPLRYIFPHGPVHVVHHYGRLLEEMVYGKETTLERDDFTVNVCNRGKEEENVYNFLSLQLLSAVVPEDSSKDRLSASRPTKALTNRPRRQLLLM